MRVWYFSEKYQTGAEVLFVKCLEPNFVERLRRLDTFGSGFEHADSCHRTAGEPLLVDLVDVSLHLGHLLWPLIAMISGAVQPTSASFTKASLRKPCEVHIAPSPPSFTQLRNMLP